jgi:hypothetical protein
VTTRLNWRAIVLLAGALSITIAMSIMKTRHSASARVDVAAPNPDATPLDYADQGLRKALAEYGMFTLGRGLDPIAPTCAPGSPETYRLVRIPGMEPPEVGFMATTVVAGGGTALVEQRIFDRTPGSSDDYAWRIAYQRQLERSEINALRDAANRWLLSGKSASPGPHLIDASEWYFEMCRLGRYHFASRYAPSNQPTENTEFLALGKTMRGLRLRENGGS